MTVTAPTPGTRARATIAAKTLRTDRWWSYPFGMFLLLGTFAVYTLIRIFMNRYYWAAEEHYLTPVYSPCISKGCVEGSAHFGTILPKMPVAIPLAILIFPILAGIRTTCYYYRKAGYRSLWLSPPACAVPDKTPVATSRRYTGETRFPLVIMNWHRYFFYLASVLLLINTYDAALAFHGKDGGIGMGLGTVIIWANLLALWSYMLSCHACRHIVGGQLKHFSRNPIRYRFWRLVSKLNTRHGQFASISLVTVILTDAYIMSVSAGWISDLRFFN